MAFEDGCEEDVGWVEFGGGAGVGVGVEGGGEVVAGAVFEGAGIGVVGGVEVVEDDGVVFAFDADAVDESVGGGVFEVGEGFSGADEAGTVVLGEAFEAGGEVDGVGDDGAVEAAFEVAAGAVSAVTRGTQHDGAGVYADTDGDRAGEADGGVEVEGVGGELEFDTGADGVFG